MLEFHFLGDGTRCLACAGGWVVLVLPRKQGSCLGWVGVGWALLGRGWLHLGSFLSQQRSTHNCRLHSPSCRRLALSFLNEDLMMQLDDLHLQQAQAVRRPTLLNIAAAQLRKVGRLPQPESQCCEVLPDCVRLYCGCYNAC